MKQVWKLQYMNAMSTIFKDNNTHAVLLVDTTNAFDQLNREAALHNIFAVYISFSTILRNAYGAPDRLFVTGEGESPARVKIT